MAKAAQKDPMGKTATDIQKLIDTLDQRERDFKASVDRVCGRWESHMTNYPSTQEAANERMESEAVKMRKYARQTLGATFTERLQMLGSEAGETMALGIEALARGSFIVAMDQLVDVMRAQRNQLMEAEESRAAWERDAALQKSANINQQAVVQTLSGDLARSHAALIAALKIEPHNLPKLPRAEPPVAMRA